MSSPLFERKAFLKSFIKEILVGSDSVTINCILPMPPESSGQEIVGVLPFVKKSEPRRTRTSNRLIKSQLLFQLS